jgi:hypothetical protein
MSRSIATASPYVLRVHLLLVGCLAALALAAPAHAAPISAHAMVHTCCTPQPLKERIFSEARELGSAYIRVDVELSGIFATPDDEPDWTGLDGVIELSKRHRLPVLGVLLAPPAGADEQDFGRMAGAVAERAAPTIGRWEVVNEPDGQWAFDGTAEQYARILSAAYGEIKARAPAARVLFGGLMRPHDPAWLERVFATPGADALHRFDIANVHLRGPAEAVVRRYGEFRSWLAARGFAGPLWVTEHGYPADPAFQVDAAYRGGDAAQAGYLTHTLVGLGELGAEQVFVTLRDNLEGAYATEGLVHIDAAAGHPASRRQAFAAVRRLTTEWADVMAWRREQRAHEQQLRIDQAAAAISAGEARTARAKFRATRLVVRSVRRALARRRRATLPRRRLVRRLERVRAVVAGRRAALLWHSALADWRRARAAEHAAAVSQLKQRIAG